MGTVLGSVLGLEWAKMRQDDSNEDIKSIKVPRNIIFKKCDFIIGKPYFLRLGGSQEEYERFRKAPKRHLKSFKTSKERVPKMEPTKSKLLDQFGSQNGPRNGPQNGPKTGPKMEPKLELHQVYRNGSGKCKYCKLQVQVQVQIMSDE